jgi:hypothetical protein
MLDLVEAGGPAFARAAREQQGQRDGERRSF